MQASKLYTDVEGAFLHEQVLVVVICGLGRLVGLLGEPVSCCICNMLIRGTEGRMKVEL